MMTWAGSLGKTGSERGGFQPTIARLEIGRHHGCMSTLTNDSKLRERSARRAERRATEGRRHRRLLLWILPVTAIVVISTWMIIQHFVVKGTQWRQLVHRLHEPMTADRTVARDVLIQWGPEIVDDLVALLETDDGRFGYPTVEVLDALGAAERVPASARIGFGLDVIARDPGGWNYDTRKAFFDLVDRGPEAIRRSTEAVASWGVWDLSGSALAAVAGLALESEDPAVVEAWTPLLDDRRPARAVRVCDVAAYVLLAHWRLPQLMWRLGMPELHGEEEFDLHFLAPIFSEARGLGPAVRDQIVGHVRALAEAPLTRDQRRALTIEQMLVWQQTGPIGDEVAWEFLEAAWLRRLASEAGREFADWELARAWWAGVRDLTQEQWLTAEASGLLGDSDFANVSLLSLLTEEGPRARLANRLLELRTGRRVWDLPAYFEWQRRPEADLAARLRGPWDRLWESLPARWIVRWPLDQPKDAEVRRGIDLEIDLTASEARAALAALPPGPLERLWEIEEQVFRALVRFQRSNVSRRDLSERALPWTHLIWIDEGEVLPEDIVERWQQVLES